MSRLPHVLGFDQTFEILQAFEVVNIKERFLVDIAAAGGGWIEAGYQRRLSTISQKDRTGSVKKLSVLQL